MSSDVRYAVNASELSADYNKPILVGTLESNDITESSGLAASFCQPDVFWTHNDTGDDAFIFAINATGKHLGTWRVTGARNTDWEDMDAFKDASGHCFLIIGDIGNNKLERNEHRIYRVAEPTVGNGSETSNRKNPLATEQADSLTFKYPDRAHDAETLLAQPQSGDLYILTKRLDGPSQVYKIGPQFGSSSGVVAAQKVGEVSLPAVPNGLLTGGGISPNGERIILCDYSAGYELDLGSGAAFDDIWKSEPTIVDIGDRKQGEAVTFGADGSSIFATSEKKNSPIFEIKRK